MNARETLAGSLQRRLHTSTVARAILELDPAGLPADAVALLQPLARADHGYWMRDDFDRPVAAERQVETWRRLFNPEATGEHADPADPEHLRDLVRIGMNVLGMGTYWPDPGWAQLALVAHSGKRLKGSTRKRLRFLARLEKRADALEGSWRLRWAQMQAKSRLAYLVDADRLDDLELAYVAYVAARANRRSEFVLGPQSRMRDEVVESLEAALLARDGRSSGFRGWFEIALVRPVPEVFGRCSPAQLGRLIGLFHDEMADAAEELSRLYGDLPERMRAEMVMVRGVDSSRWNAYAGAMNSMRSAWLGATLAAGLDTRDSYLPGKAPRLMASDLAWWYRSTGQDLHEDTTLFAALPKPWDVVLGRAHLTRQAIELTASNLGVDVSTGWTGPRRGEAPERTEPEPALVHGIAVEDPLLAATLRRCGVFSGKRMREVEEIAMTRAEVFDGRRTRVPVIAATARERARER